MYDWFTLYLETSSTVKIVYVRLIGVAIYFLTYQYANHFQVHKLLNHQEGILLHNK